jgi:hypothetical protein
MQVVVGMRGQWLAAMMAMVALFCSMIRERH